LGDLRFVLRFLGVIDLIIWMLKGRIALQNPRSREGMIAPLILREVFRVGGTVMFFVAVKVFEFLDSERLIQLVLLSLRAVHSFPLYIFRGSPVPSEEPRTLQNPS
jgi:hypothetical protein